MDNTEGVLRRAPLFDALDDEGARTLRRQMTEVKLSRGDHLFMEGDDGDSLYVVIEGKMKLTRAAADGRENLLASSAPVRCSASCRCLTRGRAPLRRAR